MTLLILLRILMFFVLNDRVVVVCLAQLLVIRMTTTGVATALLIETWTLCELCAPRKAQGISLCSTLLQSGIQSTHKSKAFLLDRLRRRN